MLWFLLLLMAVIAICSWFSPGSNLNLSAWQALDSTVAALSQDGGEDGDENDDAPRHPAPERSPPRAVTRYHTRSVPIKRKRVTPFIAKKVGALYSWRCAACGELLTEDFEVDHQISLQNGGSNDIANLRPLHGGREALEGTTSRQTCSSECSKDGEHGVCKRGRILLFRGELGQP